jgi:hypothetical protein
VVDSGPSGASIDWNWTDALSGVDDAHCQQTTTSTIFPYETMTSTCTDLAGNTVTDSKLVRTDNRGPQDDPVKSPAPNAAGWNNTDVTVDWHWTDDRVGVDPANCTQQSTTSGEVTSIRANCTNLIGIISSDVIDVNVDKTKPVDAPVVTTTASGASVAWNWSDALSGLDTTRCTQSSSQSGTGQLTLTSTCTDIAGNTATDSKAVTIATPPQKADVQAKITGPATGKAKTAYTYTVTSKDAGPGVASQVGTTVLLPQGATLVSASGSYTRFGPLLVWKIVPSLAVNASTTNTVTVKFSGKGTTGLAAATASLSTQDPNLFNNAAAVFTKIS